MYKKKEEVKYTQEEEKKEQTTGINHLSAKRKTLCLTVLSA